MFMTNYRVRKYFEDYESNVELKKDIIKTVNSKIVEFGSGVAVEDMVDEILFSPKGNGSANEIFVHFCDDVKINSKVIGVLDNYFDEDGMLYCTGSGVSIVYKIK